MNNNTELTLEQLQTITGGYRMDENGHGCIDPVIVDILKKMGWDPSKNSPIRDAFWIVSDNH